MERWIEHFSEPTRLVLSWRAPEDADQDRYRWAAGELRQGPGGATFVYYDNPEFAAMNQGRDVAKLKEAGFLGYPAFTYTPGSVFHDQVMAAFLRRLPPRSRSDFPRYLEHFRVKTDLPVSDFTLLGITEAKLPSDGFALVDPLDPQVAECELLLEVAGHRHYRFECQSLEQGRPVGLVAEPDNPHDKDAVRFEVDGIKIGHVSRFQARTMGKWLKTHRIEGWLQRLNGTPSSPRAFVFLKVRPLRQREAA